jgi:hypothetical protein
MRCAGLAADAGASGRRDFFDSLAMGLSGRRAATKNVSASCVYQKEESTISFQGKTAQARSPASSTRRLEGAVAPGACLAPARDPKSRILKLLVRDVERPRSSSVESPHSTLSGQLRSRRSEERHQANADDNRCCLEYVPLFAAPTQNDGGRSEPRSALLVTLRDCRRTGSTTARMASQLP